MAGSMAAWQRWHTWSSLACTLFLLVLCVTGLPLIFDDEIDALTKPDIAVPTVPPGTPPASLDQIIAGAHARYPGETLRFMVWDKDQPRLRLNLAASPNVPAAAGHVLVMDARTGAVLGEEGQQQGVMYTVLQIHQNLFMGLAGDLFLAVIALLFVIAIVSGVVLYGPYMRKLRFGSVRARRGRRIRWLDLHNLLGIATLLWLLVVGATGLVNTLSQPLFGLWSMREMPRLLATAARQPAPDRWASVDTVLASAHRALPGKRISSVVFPGTRFGSPRHFVLWTLGDTPLTSRMFTPALVDAGSGQVASAASLPWYLKLLELSRPLHFGDYGGLPLKIIWALLDLAAIAVLVSGLCLWWRKRQPPGPAPARQ